MKYPIILILIISLVSCGKEKVVLLPEITHSEITDIKDVSAAYLFYDETKPDSVELNRKSLISTTNWLVNVDKRLTLKQAIPHIKFLQEKKLNSSHKNENAKNYFTCNDTSRKNLGFIEFTDVVYHKSSHLEYALKKENFDYSQSLHIDALSKNKILLYFSVMRHNTWVTNIKDLNDDVKTRVEDDIGEKINIILSISKKLEFQDYITIKSIISTLNLENVTISKNEFIY